MILTPFVFVSLFFSTQRCFNGKLSPQSSDISGAEEETVKRSSLGPVGSCDEGSESRDTSGDDGGHTTPTTSITPRVSKKAKFNSGSSVGGSGKSLSVQPTVLAVGENSEGLYSCDQCDKSFSKLSSLTRHKYEHSGKYFSIFLYSFIYLRCISDQEFSYPI